MTEHSITLSQVQALRAVCLDLRRYEPQTMLIADLLRLIADDPAAAQREPGRPGLWIRSANKTKLRYLEGQSLNDHICTALEHTALSPAMLATICRRVFQTPVEAGLPVAGSEEPVIRIETGMAGFKCRCCGRCCRKLDYHRDATAADIGRWRTEGRRDILRWVGETKDDIGQTHYRIWVVPDTNQYAQTCPFLKRGRANDQWICAIQETKPAICRQYPFSRKHAVMTGCPGAAADAQAG